MRIRSFTNSRQVTVQIFPFFFFLDREISHHFPHSLKKNTTDAKLQIYAESCVYQYFLWNHVWWWITNMYTSLHQKHTGGLTSTESNHSCFRYRSASWQQRFSDTPGVILFSFTPLHHHWGHAKRCRPCSFALTHFFQQRQNEPQQTLSAVVKSTSKRRWEAETIKKTKQKCWLLNKLAVNSRLVRGRKWAWSKVARIYPSHVKTCDSKIFFLPIRRPNECCLQEVQQQPSSCCIALVRWSVGS